MRQVGGRQWLRLRHPLGTLEEVSDTGSGFARDWCGGGTSQEAQQKQCIGTRDDMVTKWLAD